ncbi:hypothetical protein ACH5RR_025125 [Cinchona calisaya]|uniref:Uncharacterized protein n=1 Tax=Cinchona calisaya TaxID=153742 RepID=A0ABD2YZU2_9GENT
MEKLLCQVENCELDHNNISNLLKYELVQNTIDAFEEVQLNISSSTSATESLSYHDFIKDDVNLCGAENKLMEDKAVPGGSADVSCSNKESSNSDKINNFSLSQLFISDDLRDQQQNNQDPSTEKSSKVEKICAMTNMSKVPLLASSLSHQSIVGHQELGSSSFSSESTPSGQSTFSGLMSCSDSISLHSNSTASTRSFAFPILATEWNGSPIRMAEVDRRKPKSIKECGCWRMCFTFPKFRML